MNVNALRDSDNDAGFYAVATSAAKSWQGATLYQSSDNGASYQVLSTFTTRATMGRAVGALGDYAGGNTVDELNTVRVSLPYGSLSSVTYANLLEGLQAALIGDEVVYFRDATLNADRTYTLRGFLRGRRGSEAAMSTHADGERFVLLTLATVKRIAQETSDIGKTRLYKMVTSGGTLAKSTAQSFKNEGAALKPYAPVLIGGGSDAAGNLIINWTRRTRISGEWRDNVDVPLGEASEAYEVDIMDATFTTVKRTLTGMTSPTVTYSAADQTADGIASGDPVCVQVYQMSATVGRGYGGKATLRTVGGVVSGGGTGGGSGGGSSAGSRDPLKQPFASTSIWNMPIGSGATYVPANLSPNPAGNEFAFMPGADSEQIVLTPTAPLTDIRYSSAAWSGADRCVTGGAVIAQVPMPSNFIVPHSTHNNGASFLKPDGRTIVQVQPLARCSVGGYATALAQAADVDLYGGGITGMHGGSGLSSIGGSIRLGELRPGQQGPKHALKVNVYAKGALYQATTNTEGFRWPATTCDSYAIGWYGTDGNNTNTAMKQGALLAIRASVDINSLGLVTEPARQLAWTLQNYGAYIVDDTYAPGFDFSLEDGAAGSKAAEFQADYGFAFAQKVGTQTTWVQDMQKIVAALYVVDNNSPSSIGGGGAPRQPLAPAISAP
jgi:hypothetical protein